MDVKKKNDVSKYQSGGNIIYVSPNDPIGMKKYQAYQDSIDAYNYGERDYPFLKGIYNTVRSPKNTEFRKNYTINILNERRPFRNTNIYPIESHYEKYERKPGTWYERNISDNRPNYYIGDNGQHYEPTGTHWARYKKPEVEVRLLKEKPVTTQKPVQPIVYKKQDVRVPVMSVDETRKIMDDLAKERKEKEDYAAYEKWVSENPLAEPEPRVNEEMEITYYKPIDIETKSPSLLQTKNPLQKVYAGPNLAGRVKSYVPREMWTKGPLEESRSLQEQYVDDKSVILNPEEFIKNRENSKKTKSKKYQAGGMIPTSSDTEIQLSKGAYNVPEPTYDASVVSNDSPMQVTDNVSQGTEQLGYKDIVKSFQKKTVDRTLPNWGYAKQEQIKLNELIRNDISTGNAKMDILVEDDIIGDNTLKAMRAYEASGQYTRPEGFKDKWLAEYKKQWDEIQATGKTKTNVPKENIIVEQPKIEESKSMLSEMYDFFNPSSKKPTNKPVGYGTVLRPEETKPKVKSMAAKYSAEKYSQKTGGWPKSALIKEGGIEINAKDLRRKDLDTYFPISGISKSKKGVRATGRDNSQAFFDAVEKEQTKTKDGSINTSLQFIDKLLSSSSKAIVIPKPGQTYGRDLMDIYLQDPYNPDRFHALDSLGVVGREAIFGKTIIPAEGTLSERQKLITKQANEKGGYKYLESPSMFRKK